MTRAEGYIKNVNTIEEFKNTDKNAMIKKAGEQVRIPVASLGSRQCLRLNNNKSLLMGG